MNLFTHISRYRLSLVTVCIFGILALVASYIVRADARFSHTYLEYAAAADDADTAVYVPTATNNPVRQEMNAMLNDVLGNALQPETRLARAKRGMELLQLSEQQIDEIAPKHDAALDAIAVMERSVSPADAIFQRGNPQKIIVFAKERAQAVSDIRALSYRADFETGKIFQHIIDSKGQLSDVYVRELNSTIPDLEEQFNKRQNRYNDLQQMLNEIQAAYADFRSATEGVF